MRTVALGMLDLRCILDTQQGVQHRQLRGQGWKQKKAELAHVCVMYTFCYIQSKKVHDVTKQVRIDRTKNTHKEGDLKQVSQLQY